MDERKIVYYVPIYEDPPNSGRLRTAALVFCANCGACVAGNGGPHQGALCVPCVARGTDAPMPIESTEQRINQKIKANRKRKGSLYG